MVKEGSGGKVSGGGVVRVEWCGSGRVVRWWWSGGKRVPRG